MEKKLEDISGADILSTYIELNPTENKFSDKDVEHFSKAFDIWRVKLIVQIQERRPLELSLNKKNYLGKKTRALLKALNWKEPKTLGLLIEKFWTLYPEAELN